MSSERFQVQRLAVWVGGQLKANRTYTETRATEVTTALNAAISTAVAGVKSDILGGASSAYDTLLELQQAIQADESVVSALSAAVAKRVRFDAAQTLTVGEQAQARTNIGAVGVDDLGAEVDYVAVALAAMNS